MIVYFRCKFPDILTEIVINNFLHNRCDSKIEGGTPTNYILLNFQPDVHSLNASAALVILDLNGLGHFLHQHLLLQIAFMFWDGLLSTNPRTNTPSSMS